MKTVIAIDSFKGCLSSSQAVEAAEKSKTAAGLPTRDFDFFVLRPFLEQEIDHASN